MSARELTMPKLSDSMADAVIVRWLKAPGQSFARGDALIEVETDKATVVYEAEADGKLDSILVPEGASVAIGEPIATLANSDGAPPSDGAGGNRPNATPVARRTAVELGVSPEDALMMGTLNPALWHGLTEYGAIAPYSVSP